VLLYVKNLTLSEIGEVIGVSRAACARSTARRRRSCASRSTPTPRCSISWRKSRVTGKRPLRG
jgi:DNA-directed RNA polymerase specialized sigma24 family protein